MRVIFVLRSILAILILVVTTAAASAFVLLQLLAFPNRERENLVVNRWAKFTMWSFGVKLKVSGQENVPAGGCLFLFNHTSFFDIFSIQSTFPEVRFGAKIELFSIPIFGRALRNSGHLPIARAQREEVFKVYEGAKERAKLGEKFALAPEGSRTSGDYLRPFKTGPFVFAISAEVPIVPVIIRGAREVMAKNEIPNTKNWTREISVTYCPPISTQGFTLAKRAELQEITYQKMKSYFDETI